MLRFAVDPILQNKEEGSFVKVAEESKITNDPQEFHFELKQQDGWYNSTATLTAWIRKNDQGEIVALSPICKHLGCLVGWNNNKISLMNTTALATVHVIHRTVRTWQ